MSLQTSVFLAPPSLDLDRHCSRHHVGHCLHLQLHLPLQPDQAAVVSGTPRTLHRPDAGAQVAHPDKHLHRSLYLHPAHQICLETTDAENGEGRSAIMLCSRRSVRIPILPSPPFSLLLATTSDNTTDASSWVSPASG